MVDCAICHSFCRLYVVTLQHTFLSKQLIYKKEYRMQRNNKILGIVALCCLSFTACNDDSTRFEGEMEQANNLIKGYVKAGNVSVVYTTRTSGMVRNNVGGTISLSKSQPYSKEEITEARLSVSSEDICRTGFYSLGNNRFTISSGNTSMFYVAQISFVASDETDRGTILLAGLGRNSLPYSYSLSLPEVNGEYLNIQGKSLIGNGSVTVEILE